MDNNQIQKLKAAGFSDQDIADYDQSQTTGAPTPVAGTDTTAPAADEAIPAYVGEAYHERSNWEYPAMAVNAVTSNAFPIAGALGGAATLYKANKVANAWMGKNAAETTAIQAQTAQRAEAAAQAARTAAGHQELQYAKMAARAPVQAGSVAPQILDAAGRPMAPAAMPTAPIAPAAMPAAPIAQVAEQPGIMQRGADIASKMRQFAASKVLGPAGEALGAAGKMLAPLAPAARVLAGPIGTGAQLLLHSGSTGPQVPMQGPFRGMEINPTTGRPWTPQELAQINGR
jgi:hypothetical protein